MRTYRITQSQARSTHPPLYRNPASNPARTEIRHQKRRVRLRHRDRTSKTCRTEPARTSLRHDFGSTVYTTELLETLGHIQLDIPHPLFQAGWIEQRLPMPDLVKPAVCDPFSISPPLSAFFLISYNIVRSHGQTRPYSGLPIQHAHLAPS